METNKFENDLPIEDWDEIKGIQTGKLEVEPILLTSKILEDLGGNKAVIRIWKLGF